MKHNKQITHSHASIDYEDVRPLVEKLALHLSRLGISASIDKDKESNSENLFINFNFAKEIVGRDCHTKALVHCKGFQLYIHKDIGADEAQDENGRFIWDKENKCVKTIGPEYEQWQISFIFKGKMREYRCRNWSGIGSPIAFDYDDDINEFDFTPNIDWLAITVR